MIPKSPDFDRLKEALVNNHKERDTILRELNEKFPPPDRWWQWEIDWRTGEPKLVDMSDFGAFS